MSVENLPFDTVKIGTLTLTAQKLVPRSASFSRTGSDVRIDGVAGKSVFLRLSARQTADFQVYGDHRAAIAAACNTGKAEVKLYDGATLFSEFEALVKTDYNQSDNVTAVSLSGTENL